MDREARELDQLVRDCWIQGFDNPRLSAVLDLALTARPTSLVPLARAFQILEWAPLAPTLIQRLGLVRSGLAGLVLRENQIHSLGDLDNEPETLFAVFGEELSTLEGYDPDKLRKARLGQQGSRASAAEAFLETLGWKAFSAEMASELKSAIADLKDRERFESWGLFVGEDRKNGIALGINFVMRETGNEVIDIAAAEIRQQARIVASQLLQGAGWETNVEWPAAFAGESIGLPLSIAALTAREEIPRDALLASTGRVDISGNVLGVAGISAKIEAASRLGMRRVVVPKENYPEATSAARHGLVVIPISNIRELAAALRQSVSAIDVDFAALLRLVRASARDYGLLVTTEKEHPHGRCFVVGNTAGKVNLWVYTNGRVMAQGGAGPVLEAAERLIRERVPAAPEARPTHSFEMLTEELRGRSLAVLHEVGARHEEPHETEEWRLRIQRGRSSASIVLYRSGKCVLQGTAPAWQVAFDTMDTVFASLGGLVAAPRSHPDRVIESVDPTLPHIGTDEAGKGDYFGPLVCAAVYVDSELAGRLRSIGVRDSKALSDGRVKEMAERIRELAEGRYAVTSINPPKFNELYSQFAKEKKNLNSLLAWGHARSIERLLTAPSTRGIRPEYVLVDQFADARHVEDRTRRTGLKVYQRPRAEDDIAVAAASVLARDAFLAWLDKWSGRCALKLPKGASEHVIAVGKEVIRRWGRPALGDLAKLSFRTTKQVVEGEEENVARAAPPWAADSESTRNG
jgi:ribonuclease HIII